MGLPDVIVIGGGIAGVSIAYELAAQRRVLLLEAEPSLAMHSTGKSAATYLPGHGSAPVRALIRASGPRFARLAAELDAHPFLEPLPVIWAAFDAEGEAALARSFAEWADEPDAPQPLTAAQTVARVPELRGVRAGAVSELAAAVDAIGLHGAYVRGLRARGGEVRRQARVVGLTAASPGWQVMLSDGTELSTAEVVNAAGAWADGVAALAGAAPVGLRSYRRTIVISPASYPPGLPMVVEAGERFYLKPEGDAVLFSPGDETPAGPGEVRPDELDIAIALERVEQAIGLGLRSVRTAWAGLRTFAPDRVPVVGARPERPGLWFFAGQGGSGIESAPALAALGAAVVTGTSVPADIDLDPELLSPSRFPASAA